MSESSLAEAIIGQARSLGLTIAVAESLTGGLVAARLVDVAGASDVFVGGVVAYHPDLKHTLLGVDSAVLHERGAVQETVALQMALGVRERCALDTVDAAASRRADLSLATTGVAGPDADPITGQQPGTVWIAVSSSQGTRAERFQFSGDRKTIRDASVEAALGMLAQELQTLA